MSWLSVLVWAAVMSALMTATAETPFGRRRHWSSCRLRFQLCAEAGNPVGPVSRRNQEWGRAGLGGVGALAVEVHAGHDIVVSPATGQAGVVVTGRGQAVTMLCRDRHC